MKTFYLSIAAVMLALLAITLGIAQDTDTSMSFFVTSAGPGNGANLGGLEGADAHCQKMPAGGAAKGNWRAYLGASADGGKAAVNARDRIGKGPWYNAKGVKDRRQRRALAFRQEQPKQRNGAGRER